MNRGTMDDMNGMVRLPGRWLFALLFLFVASPSAAGIKVALLPAQQTVAPGDTFDLSIEVTEAGTAFNGFDLSIGFDPTALTFIQRSPVSQQEGAYFVAACPSQRFHQFQAAADSLAITDVLLCAMTPKADPTPDAFVACWNAKAPTLESSVMVVAAPKLYVRRVVPPGASRKMTADDE